SAFLVAVLGVIAPSLLGWLASTWLLPAESGVAHVFIGTTLCATSVGITARVLKDLGRLQSAEARIVVGAAVIDDVLGLMVLSVVTGVVVAANTGSHVEIGAVGLILGKAALFFVGAIGLGLWTAPRLMHLAARLQSRGVLLATALIFCFVLS